jgi:CheY-like chemotaxis protein
MFSFETDGNLPALPGDRRMRILVVDDEPDQLDTICCGLLLYGYDYIKAHHGGQALDYLNGPYGHSIDLLLTDLTMPGKSGLELIQQVHQQRPDLPAIATTGLSYSSDMPEIRRRKITVLKKPFAPRCLDRAICKLNGQMCQ